MRMNIANIDYPLLAIVFLDGNRAVSDRESQEMSYARPLAGERDQKRALVMKDPIRTRYHGAAICRITEVCEKRKQNTTS
jgi:hypothetical protein